MQCNFAIFEGIGALAHYSQFSKYNLHFKVPQNALRLRSEQTQGLSRAN